MEPYYEGDAVELQFFVKEKLEPLVPSGATVSIIRGKEELIPNQSARIKKNEVSFVVPSTATKKSGDYKAVFTVYIAPDQPRTHIIWFRILSKTPAKGEEEIKLTKDSSDYEVSIALASALRSLRRAGESITKAAKVGGDIISRKSHRRLPMNTYGEEEDA